MHVLEKVFFLDRALLLNPVKIASQRLMYNCLKGLVRVPCRVDVGVLSFCTARPPRVSLNNEGLLCPFFSMSRAGTANEKGCIATLWNLIDISRTLQESSIETF